MILLSCLHKKLEKSGTFACDYPKTSSDVLIGKSKWMSFTVETTSGVLWLAMHREGKV